MNREQPAAPRMKSLKSMSDLASRCAPAALLAAQLVTSGLPADAWAQSAMPNDGPSPISFDSANTRLRTPATDDEPVADEKEPQDTNTATAIQDPDAAENDDAALDAAASQELRRQNAREETVDGLRPRLPDDPTLTPGIPFGTFTFRPTTSQSVGMERTRTGKEKTTRTYLETGFKGSLVSDWSLHQLRIDAEGTWQKTLSGDENDDPEGRINAELRLDMSRDTIATLRAGYSLEREDIGDPNAISGAADQAEVSTYTASAAVTHDLGLIRGTAAIDFTRETYGEATLANGTEIDQSDRNNNEAILRGRIGYELSPAIIPFLEASYGQAVYDNEKDSLGYRRDATLYAARAGVEGDFGEKLRGEISTGYEVADFQDSRLKAIDAWAIDGNATWSPQRGTDVLLGLKTEIEPSTTAGASGSVAYTASAALTHAIIEELSGRLNTAYTWRDYSEKNVANQNVVDAGVGLSWGLSRSIDITGDVTWERTWQAKVPNQDQFTAMMGVALKR